MRCLQNKFKCHQASHKKELKELTSVRNAKQENSYNILECKALCYYQKIFFGNF